MNEFLETYNLPILNLEEIENLNRQITTSKEIKEMMKNLTSKKVSRMRGLLKVF